MLTLLSELDFNLLTGKRNVDSPPESLQNEHVAGSKLGIFFVILGVIRLLFLSYPICQQIMSTFKNLTTSHHFDCYHPTQATMISHLGNCISFLTRLPLLFYPCFCPRRL